MSVKAGGDTLVQLRQGKYSLGEEIPFRTG
jgi:hypothetical protein